MSLQPKVATELMESGWAALGHMGTSSALWMTHDHAYMHLRVLLRQASGSKQAKVGFNTAHMKSQLIP